MSEAQQPDEPVVVRDNRKLDPETGEVRGAAAAEPAPGRPTVGGPDDGAEDAELDAAQTLAAQRLDELQRLNAEYANYRKRVERDRDVAKNTALAGVAESLLPVLDDIHLARQHGDLTGPFVAIADKLEATLTRFGLERYGENGEPFDPAVHEALMRTEAELAEGTTTTTVVQVLQPGYRSGDRVLRAARVAVADPN